MISLVYYGIIAACVLALTAILFQTSARIDKKSEREKPISMEDYLFKISRVTGHSEYDVFCKSAEDWPVSRERIEQDFTRYLQQQSVPHYVNDFVRRNKKYIDELHIPRF
ncbi:MAG: hypothetical protein V2I56_13250 [Desulfobacteraceae bacterium]|jgi:hypothetical protein|nr:hypothetical protein [Desulfobacteraceae bacterium]